MYKLGLHPERAEALICDYYYQLIINYLLHIPAAVRLVSFQFYLALLVESQGRPISNTQYMG